MEDNRKNKFTTLKILAILILLSFVVILFFLVKAGIDRLTNLQLALCIVVGIALGMQPLLIMLGAATIVNRARDRERTSRPQPTSTPNLRPAQPVFMMPQTPPAVSEERTTTWSSEPSRRFVTVGSKLVK